jgi:hypothetical protein
MIDRGTAGEDSRPVSWSIGIFRGASPLDLAPAPDVTNPVLTARSVDDVAAHFVADPFMVRHEGTWHMFFEIYVPAMGRGVIGLAVSPDARRWEYRGVVLAEPFHLSYPHVVRAGGDYYMTPETLDHGHVRLYRCREFPHRWEPAGDLIEGRCADPSMFFHEGAWWMFVGKPQQGHATLRLYRAPRPEGPWAEHPASPIIADDPLAARPAGRVVLRDGSLIRFAQECRPVYGSRVRAFEVLRLGPSEYLERPAGPVLGPGESAWNRGRMHHVDAHPIDGGTWIACVDGNPSLGGGDHPGKGPAR